MKSESWLKKSAEFQRVFNIGQKIIIKGTALAFIADGNLPKSRAGIVVPAKLGTAVERNKIKRRFREVFIALRNRFNRPFDIVFLPNRQTKFLKTENIKVAVNRALQHIGSLRSHE